VFRNARHLIPFASRLRVRDGGTHMSRRFGTILRVCACVIGVVAAAASSGLTLTVTNTNDGGAGSFRQAILDANASAESDLIQFAIPGSGPHTIVTFTPLNVSGSVLIDGYSQPGSAWNSDPIADNAVIQVELLGQGTDGLVITGGAAIVQGLALYGFDAAIALTTVEGSIIQGNFIGTDAAGNATFGNNRGVLITSPFGSDKVGDAYPAARIKFIEGDRAPLQVLRAELDRRQKAIDHWLEEAAESEDE